MVFAQCTISNGSTLSHSAALQDENVPSHFANGKAPSWIVQYGNKEIGLLSSLARPFRRLSSAASGRDYHSVASSRPTLLGIEGLQKVVVYCKVKQPSYIRRHVDHRSSKDFTPSEMWTVSRGYETHVVSPCIGTGPAF